MRRLLEELRAERNESDLKRTLVHLSIRKLEILDDMRDENTSRAAHIRLAIDAYIKNHQRRAAARVQA